MGKRALRRVAQEGRGWAFTSQDFRALTTDSWTKFTMASLWRRPNSKNWWACFTARDGKRFKRSTGSTVRKAAQEIANDYEKAARLKQTALQTRKTIVEMHQRITGQDLKAETVRGYIASWLKAKTPETAPATLAFYRSATGKFLDFLGEDQDPELTEVTREMLTDFRNAEAERVSPKTVNHFVKCLRMVFKAALRESLIAEDPTVFVQVVRNREASERRPFTLEELRSVLAAADDEWKSLVKFGFYTGQRLGDLSTLTWGQIDLPRNELRFTTAKTGRRILIPIAAPLRAHIDSLGVDRSPQSPVHPRAFAIVKREGKTSSLSNQFADVLAAAGLRKKKSHKKVEIDAGAPPSQRDAIELSFHCLRRTATTMLHEAGIPGAVAQELIGHDSEDIHRSYVNVGREALNKAAASLPALE